MTTRTDLKSREFTRTVEDWLFDKGADPDARLFIWYAGHGHTDSRGEGFLVPTDSPLPSKSRIKFSRSALSLRRFGEWLRLVESKHVYAVFDSCFAGTIFESARAAPPPAITLATTRPVRQFLTSGDADQTVSDDGTFRRLFIEALKGQRRADANGDGFLTASELGLFMGDRITNYSNGRQTPRHGKLNDPDYDRGDFVFAQLSSVKTAPPTKSAAAASSADPKLALDTAIWSGIKDSQNASDFRDYIARTNRGDIPGIFKSNAESRIAALLGTATTTPKPPKTNPTPRPPSSGDPATDAYAGPPPSAFPKRLQPLAERAFAGDIEAQKQIGYRYRKGDGLTTNWRKAKLWFEKAAETGDQEARYLLLEARVKSWDDLDKLKALYREGYIPAGFELYRYIGATGYTIDTYRDIEAAKELVEEWAQSNNPDQLMMAAEFYFVYNSWHPYSDVERAYQLYKKAGELGDGRHKILLAHRYRSGFATDLTNDFKNAIKFPQHKSPAEAQRWFKAAKKDIKRVLAKSSRVKRLVPHITIRNFHIHQAMLSFGWPAKGTQGDWGEALWWARLILADARKRKGSNFTIKRFTNVVRCLEKQVRNRTPHPQSGRAANKICHSMGRS